MPIEWLTSQETAVGITQRNIAHEKSRINPNIHKLSSIRTHSSARRLNCAQNKSSARRIISQVSRQTSSKNRSGIPHERSRSTLRARAREGGLRTRVAASDDEDATLARNVEIDEGRQGAVLLVPIERSGIGLVTPVPVPRLAVRLRRRRRRLRRRPHRALGTDLETELQMMRNAPVWCEESEREGAAAAAGRFCYMVEGLFGNSRPLEGYSGQCVSRLRQRPPACA